MAKKIADISEARRHDKYERLIAAAKQFAALPTAVAHPCDETSLRGAMEASDAGMIVPILVGPKKKISGCCVALRSEHRTFRAHRRWP